MIKGYVLFLFSLVLSASIFCPALAEQLERVEIQPTTAETQANPLQTASSTSVTPQSDDPDLSSNTGKSLPQSLCKLPKKVGAYLAGVVVNTPVAIVSKSKDATISDILELVGDNRNPVFLGAAGTISLPFGITSGVFDGVWESVTNNWKHDSN
jgi:hypothetical protein